MHQSDLQPMTQQIFDFIRDYWETHHMSPSLRQIGKACYLHHSSVIVHLARLEAMEWIIREIGIPRSIRLGSRAPKRGDGGQTRS